MFGDGLLWHGLKLSDLSATAIGIGGGLRRPHLSLKVKGGFFEFFCGMVAASLDNAIADLMDTIPLV
jgi:hypothetical protein